MTLKTYQQNAVAKLYTKAITLLGKPGMKICVFKAPTGSGKTIMAADFLRQIANGQPLGRFVFLWISSNNLHTQSKNKVSSYLADSRYSFLLLDEIADTKFEENQVIFVNWESLTKQDKKTGEFKNVFMRDTEAGKNLQTLIRNSKESGLEIILIVDESHYHYWSKKSQELVQGVIGPKLVFEVSATPAVVPTAEEIEREDAAFVSVKFEDVVKEEMIKESTVVNEAISKYSDFKNTEDKVIIEAAIAKRDALHTLYKKEGSAINPLLLVQLPSESQATSALDKTKLKEVEQILKDKHDITVENGKLGVWLSERKDNLRQGVNGETILDDVVEVLLFKQAIALGWDCPRAQILLMFRDIKVERFEIQTVGRIMRMPEQKHYENDTLNQAYVYTNLNRISIAHDGTSEGYFKIYRAVRKKSYKPIDFPSVYLSRIDYGDLTLSFRHLFIEEANKYFNIGDKDAASKAKAKADDKLDLLPQELTKVIISDAIIKNLDEQVKKEVLGRGKAEFAVSPDEIKRAYETFAKATSLPFAPVRSHTKIQQAIYDWFDKCLGYEKISRLEIQRIVVCSETNQKIFKEIIEAAKERFKEVDRKEKQAKQRRKEYKWNVPEVDYFNENHEFASGDRAIMVYPQKEDKTLLEKTRSSQEKNFEELLEKTKSVTWWYKNGESKETYFAIPYTDPTTGLERSFYPDYIVQFSNGAIGIYDTKSGFTKDTKEAAAKSDALCAYISKIKKLKGGFVSQRPAGWFVFMGPKYTSDESKWSRLDL